jgi:hypothetical protein
MSIISKIATLGVLVLTVLVGATSCGSGASNNDQGASFSAIGFFGEDEQGKVDPEIGEVGQFVPINFDTSLQYQFAGIDVHTALTYIGVQNRLLDQFIRVHRVDCSYDIQGSSLRVPDDSFPISLFLAPGADVDPITGEAPERDETAPIVSIQYAQFEIVSPDILDFLNANVASLPALPFRMTAVCSATGVTQGGDTLTTNSLNYMIQFVEFSECCTGTPGFQTGEGTGGTITFAGGGQAAGATFGETVLDDGSEGSSESDSGGDDNSSVSSEDFTIE